MQTKHQIQQLLASAGVRPNKKLGQHFLIDLNLMRLLVGSANISNNDIVLEIGCGTGSLTEVLVEKAGLVIAVELDRVLAEIAKSRLANTPNLKLIHADVLKSKHTFNPAVTDALETARKKYSGRVLLVANLPYNVASPVIINLVTGPSIVDAMYVTVQKEVADRMTAPPGSSNYGALSIFLAATGDVKTIRVLKPTVFWPAPKVDSEMVSFVRNQVKSERIENMKLFIETVNLFMGHRRKMLKTSSKLANKMLIKIENWSKIFKKCSIDPQKRPGQLCAEDFIAIANFCHSASVDT
jgi:16S rRNA (adenine1518-N6/adenine1519-N6)-dimethyltransferase